MHICNNTCCAVLLDSRVRVIQCYKWHAYSLFIPRNALDPHGIWKQFFKKLRKKMCGKNNKTFTRHERTTIQKTSFSPCWLA